MKTTNTFRTDSIVNVEVEDFIKNTVFYEYRPEMKLFSLVVRKAGVYDKHFGDLVTELSEERKKHYVLKDDGIYYLPRVIITLSSNKQLQVRCQTFEEAWELARLIRTSDQEWQTI